MRARTLVDLLRFDLRRDPMDAPEVELFADCLALDLNPEPLASPRPVPAPPVLVPIIPGR